MTKDESPARSALKLALEALKEGVDGQTSVEMDQAITAILSALALVNEVDQEQPAQQQVFVCSTGLCHYKAQQQEPVAKVDYKQRDGFQWLNYLGWQRISDGASLYTSPPNVPTARASKPLTDEQINLFINGRGDEDDDDYVEPTGDGFGLTDADLVRLVRRVEAAHGITKE